MTMPGIPLVMSVREVASLLGLGRNLVYAMIADGTLRSVKAGRRRILIPRQALTEFLADPTRRDSAEALPPHWGQDQGGTE